MILSKTQTINKILPYIFLSICLLSLILSQHKYYKISLNNDKNNNSLQKEKEIKATLKIQKKIPSFGFNNLRANWIFLNFIQYFGDKKARNHTGHSLIADYFETLLKYDPHFTQAYLTLSTANTIYAAKPDKTIALMEQVLQSTSPEVSPYTSSLWTVKALDELLFLGDTKAAHKSYNMATQWANQRGDELGKNIAIRNQKTADFLATNPDTTKAQIASWKMILPNVRDSKTRQEILDKIESLEKKMIEAQQ
jgi:hypothetical protein